jgi:glycosyltransferase involved in cell wall biosynthesis
MIGDMAYDPNLDGAEWLIKEVWPIVESLRPDARLRMIGRNADHLANRCPELRSTISIHPDVQDLSEDLLAASLSVAPMPKVTGTPIKVLQSFVWQVPVVATSVVAGAFGTEAADFLLVADSPDDFARSIVRLLEDDDLRSRMVAAGLDRFQRHHSAARFAESIDALVEFAGDLERTGGESQRRLRLEQRGIRLC